MRDRVPRLQVPVRNDSARQRIGDVSGLEPFGCPVGVDQADEILGILEKPRDAQGDIFRHLRVETKDIDVTVGAFEIRVQGVRI